jgi:mannosylglycoprotein endo-beta-mannosidase
MTGKYKDLVNNYGPSNSIDAFAQKAQLLGAMNSKSIWEVWNYNKFGYGDRYASGLLFWYHNSPTRQVCGRMWDWSLEPTASLYHTQNALEPLHPQFDYLKSTVSVYNDYLQSFTNYKLTAEVYDLYSKRVGVYSKMLNVIPEDGVLNDVIKIDFAANITPVHFIKLLLTDEKGKVVGSNFYWRSTDKYLGKTTLTGPAAGGFESLASLKQTSLTTKASIRKKDNEYLIELDIKNNSKTIAFFTQLQLLDKEGKPVRPSFYTDNFYSLLPGESKHIGIETNVQNLAGEGNTLVVKGYNVLPAIIQINKIKGYEK